MEDRISRELQHCHKTYCEKGGHHGRRACMVWRWFHCRDIVSRQVDLYMTLSRDPIVSLLAFSLTAFFQILLSTGETFLAPALLLLPPISLPPPLHPISPIPLLLSLPPSFFPFSVSFSYPFLLSFCWLLLLLLFPFVFPTPIFSVLASIAFHIPLDISSSLLLLFSNQSQDCGKLAMASPRSPSTSVL